MNENYIRRCLRTSTDDDPPKVPEFLPDSADEIEHLRELRDFVGMAIHWLDDDETPGRLKFYIQMRDAFVEKYRSLPEHSAGELHRIIQEETKPLIGELKAMVGI